MRTALAGGGGISSVRAPTASHTSLVLAAESRIVPSRRVYVVIVTPPSGTGRELHVLGSVFPVGPGQTVYVGIGFSLTESRVAIPMRAGTISAVSFSSAVAPGSGNTFTFTLRLGSHGAMNDTGLAGSLTGSSQVGSDVEDVTVTDNQLVDIRVVASNGCPDAHLNCSFVFEPA